MDEASYPNDQNELSADDRAVLRAFDEMEDREVESSAPATSMQEPLPQADSSPGDMLLLFTSEAAEDIATMRRVLHQLEQDDLLDAASFLTLQRTAHKLKGTAGAIGCNAMSAIARYIEMLIPLIKEGPITPLIGLDALVHAVVALEVTLNGLISNGQESSTPLAELEAEYRTLGINSIFHHVSPGTNSPTRTVAPVSEEEEETFVHKISRPTQEVSPSAPLIRVGVRRFDQLIMHTEQLAELRTPLESAQAQVELALQELHAAQARLRHLEMSLISAIPFSLKTSNNKGDMYEERPTSTLVARILDEAEQRSLSKLRRHSLKSHGTLPWDELEVDRFTESNVLIHSFSEAIADVATASSQLRIAFAQLNRIVQKYMTRASTVQNDTLMLQLTPLNTLLPRLRRAVEMSTIGQKQQVQFETEGETIEIDQDILEALKHPLLQLVRNCIADSFLPSQEVEQSQQPCRTWLNARVVGNDVDIQLGFSMKVRWGSGSVDALDAVRETMRRLHGSISAQRNATGGVSFDLRFPRSRGAVQGLLVRAGSQRVIVPFSQVQRIDYAKQEPVYLLNELLCFPAQQSSTQLVRPVLILQAGAVQVDEILEAVELVMKPLPPHLYRPGIAGTTIDGMGNVLLMLDLPELIRHQKVLQRASTVGALQGDRKLPQHSEQTQQTILVADDSVYVRQSLLQTLSYEGYRVMEAHDGTEALEKLLGSPPSVLLLDIEMPNLNGYDLLSIMRVHPELARVKIVMLSSRSSEKHRRHAHELGAHAYLIKPCPQEILLETLQSVLASA